MAPDCEHPNRKKTGNVFYVAPLKSEWVCLDCGSKWSETDSEDQVEWDRRMGIREPPLYPRVDSNLMCTGCGLVLSKCHEIGCRSKPPKPIDTE